MAHAEKNQSNVIQMHPTSRTDTSPIQSQNVLNHILDRIEEVKAYQIAMTELVESKSKTKALDSQNIQIGSDYVYSFDYKNTGIGSNYFYIEPKDTTSEYKSMNYPKGVPAFIIMEFFALILGFICVISMITWIIVAIPLINPTLSIIGIIASITFYIMGRVSRKEYFEG